MWEMSNSSSVLTSGLRSLMEILRPVSPVIRGEGNKLSRTDVAREPPAQFFHGSNATFIINFCTAWYIHPSGSLNNSIRGSGDRTEFRKKFRK